MPYWQTGRTGNLRSKQIFSGQKIKPENKNARAMRAFLFGMGHFLPIKFPNATAVAIPDESGQVTGNEFCHFKHGDLRFTTENGFQLVICIDVAFVSGLAGYAF
jgi:hypothetical protein